MDYQFAPRCERDDSILGISKSYNGKRGWNIFRVNEEKKKRGRKSPANASFQVRTRNVRWIRKRRARKNVPSAFPWEIRFCILMDLLPFVCQSVALLISSVEVGMYSPPLQDEMLVACIHGDRETASRDPKIPVGVFSNMTVPVFDGGDRGAIDSALFSVAPNAKTLDTPREVCRVE